MEEIWLFESQDSGYVLYWGQIHRKSLLRVKCSWKRKIGNSIFEEPLWPMLKLCSTHVLFMFISCSVHVYFMYKPGSSHVQVKFKVFKSCSSPVQILFTLLSNNFQVMCKLCSSHIQVMFNLCQVQVMFKSLARYAHQYQFGCGILKGKNNGVSQLLVWIYKTLVSV